MKPHPNQTAPHFFTVDVEEWFHVAAFEKYVSVDDWSRLESRVEQETDVILDLLDRRGMVGTFFTLGWVAERAPALIRRIVEAGHELASHGWWHRRVTASTPDEFREEVRTSKATLEDIGGVAVLGYRAPNFSIVPGREWAFDVLLEEGYAYDSSLFPVPRRGYGYPSSPGHPYVIRRPSGDLLEVPIAVSPLFGIPVPASGGAYFRTFPYFLVKRTFWRYADQRRHGCFYVHPWEVDPDQPRLKVDWVTYRRHYGGLEATQARMDRLLRQFDFTSIARVFFPEEQMSVGDLEVVALSR